MNADPVGELLAVLDTHFPFLKSTRARLRRQLAAAGLARCRALLEGMVLLRDATREDVIGVLLRALCEAWMVSLYVLYKGENLDDDSVLIELAADYETWTRKMAGKVGGWAEGNKAEEILADWGAELRHWEEQARADGKASKTPAKLNYETIARELGSLLEKVEGAAPDILSVYDRVYRGESIYSAHAGLGMLWRYLGISEDERQDAVVERPGPAFPVQVKVGALLTAYLALRVFKEFSVIVRPPLAEVYERIKGMKNPETTSYPEPSRVWRLDVPPVQKAAALLEDVARELGREKPELVPDAPHLTSLLDSVFWATMLPNEGRYSRFSILYAPRDYCGGRVDFPSPVALTSKALRDLAPTVPAGAHLGVTPDGDHLVIWGVALDSPMCVTIRALRPGRIMLGIGPENLILIDGPEAGDLIWPGERRHGVGRPHCAAVLGAGFGASVTGPRQRVMGVLLLMVAEAMVGHGNGGTILIVPRVDEALRGRLDLGRPATLDPSLREFLEKYVREAPDDASWDPMDGGVADLQQYLNGRRWKISEDLRRVVEAVGRLTAVDGAIVLTYDLDLIAAESIIKVTATSGDLVVRRSLLSWGRSAVVPVSQLGGTRRQSAASFVLQDREYVAITSSHDGPLTFATWFLAEGDGPRVGVIHDVEALLD
jgi:hypothetical protein